MRMTGGVILPDGDANEHSHEPDPLQTIGGLLVSGLWGIAPGNVPADLNPQVRTPVLEVTEDCALEVRLDWAEITRSTAGAFTATARIDLINLASGAVVSRSSTRSCASNTEGNGGSAATVFLLTEGRYYVTGAIDQDDATTVNPAGQPLTIVARPLVYSPIAPQYVASRSDTTAVVYDSTQEEYEDASLVTVSWRDSDQHTAIEAGGTAAYVYPTSADREIAVAASNDTNAVTVYSTVTTT